MLAVLILCVCATSVGSSPTTVPSTPSNATFFVSTYTFPRGQTPTCPPPKALPGGLALVVNRVNVTNGEFRNLPSNPIPGSYYATQTLNSTETVLRWACYCNTTVPMTPPCHDRPDLLLCDFDPLVVRSSPSESIHETCALSPDNTSVITVIPATGCALAVNASDIPQPDTNVLVEITQFSGHGDCGLLGDAHTPSGFTAQLWQADNVCSYGPYGNSFAYKCLRHGSHVMLNEWLLDFNASCAGSLPLQQSYTMNICTLTRAPAGVYTGILFLSSMPCLPSGTPANGPPSTSLSAIIGISVVVAIVVVLLLILFLKRRAAKRHPPDYRILQDVQGDM